MKLGSMFFACMFLGTVGSLAHSNDLSCEADYAVGLGHLLKGEGVGGLKFYPGKPAADRYHKISVREKGSIFKDLIVSITNLRSDQTSELVLKKSMGSIYMSFVTVLDHPKELTGLSSSQIVYLFILCSEESRSR